MVSQQKLLAQRVTPSTSFAYAARPRVTYLGDRNVFKIVVTFLQLYAVTTVCLPIAITVTHRRQ